ncbi:terminase family protein [Lysobacter sp. K5869]|uniref:terminase large subunit domain-containing protein n=1 Tax=Lysobacter sp. K5869 TaxID=2820808 RepID=UPI001C064166|nr:terminase family protein [Lysobacter sp. K5869]QWP79222.1 terminase family protein [Lysobacter sp. K5869]
MALTAAEKREQIALIEESLRRRRENRLALYRPYAKQAEFHALGAAIRERLLMAGNQLGKTWCAGFESSMHLCGRYPDWWEGRTWNRGVAGWAAGVTTEVTRDSVQRVLCGRINAIGTGAIPKNAIKSYTKKRGVADALDTVVVLHGGGGDIQADESLLTFKSYDQGREKFQAETLDFVWLDEEPDEDIYTEALTRTNATGGINFMTFTPLKGVTTVVKRFLVEKVPGSQVVGMTIEDAEHYTPEQRAAIIASYPAHEREARTKGIPMLGSGRVFPIEEAAITVQPFAIPREWVQIGGLDFGYDHPFGAVRLAWDRDADVLYVISAYRERLATPVIHAAALRPWGDWLPWAWPHDGLQHDKGSGEELAKQYRDQKLNMLPERATFEDGGNGVEAGVTEMLDRMQTGRLKVFAHLSDWFEEFRLYHRENGRIVKLNDDLLSATRYALMMRRFAETSQAARPLQFRSEFG